MTHWHDWRQKSPSKELAAPPGHFKCLVAQSNKCACKLLVAPVKLALMTSDQGPRRPRARLAAAPRCPLRRARLRAAILCAFTSSFLQACYKLLDSHREVLRLELVKKARTCLAEKIVTNLTRVRAMAPPSHHLSHAASMR